MYTRVLNILFAAILLTALPSCRWDDAPAPAAATPASGPAASLRTVNGVRVLTLSGSPEEMGRAHAELLGDDVRWVVAEVIGVHADNDVQHQDFRRNVALMEGFLEDRWRRELHALADAAGVDYMDLVGLQLFGDVGRAQFCSSFAAFGRATSTGECVVGRNFDYWYRRVAERASIVIDYHPEGRPRFVTVTWAGVINGWTLMNEHGIVTANNTAYGFGRNSLEGISTCFMLRKVAEESRTVAEGIEVVRKAPRACGTNLIIAGGDPPAAAVIEYDHERFHARMPKDDAILATNSFLELGEDEPQEPTSGRYGTLAGLIRDHYGKIDRTMNFAGAEGVPLGYINLHSVMLYPRDLTLAVAMGKVPAYQQPYRWLRMTPAGIEPVDAPVTTSTEGKESHP